MEFNSGGDSAPSSFSGSSQVTSATFSPPKKKLRYDDGSHESNSVTLPVEPGKGRAGLAASLLCLNPAVSSVAQGSKAEKLEEFLDLPHSVLQMTATGLQCDLIIAGLLSHGLLETVLCVPKGLVNVPVRLSKGLLNKNTCEVRQSRLFTKIA